MAMRTMVRRAMALAVLAGAGGAMAAPPAADDAAMLNVVEAFGRARLAYDPPAIAATITADYVEVSPVGDIDLRDAMLGFYAPDRRRPAPPMTTDERSVRRQGDSGIVLARVTYRMPGPDGAVRDRSLRVGYMLRRERGGWRIAATQATPMR